MGVKQRINGRIYDTSTSRLIATTTDGTATKKLYKKSTGEFFELVTYGDGEFVRPIAAERALREWSGWMNDDAISQAFAVAEPRGGAANIYLSADTRSKIDWLMQHNVAESRSGTIAKAVDCFYEQISTHDKNY